MRPGWETHYSGRCAAEHGYPNWTRPAYLHKGPRRLKGRNFEAGHTTAPDHVPDRTKKCLHSWGRPHTSGLTGVDLFCCPAPRHEVVQTVHLVVCNAGENPAQPGFRIDLVHAAGFDERIGDGCGIAAAF